MQTQTLKIVLPRPFDAQKEIIRRRTRYTVLDCGRRFGKNVVSQNLIIRPALEGRPVAWTAPSYKMLSDDWKAVKSCLHPVIKRTSEQEKQLELITGGVVDFWSLDAPDSLRGRKYARVVVNEAAMVKDLLDVWSMVIRPTLADYQGDAIFPSTPKGLNGFYALWQRSKDDPEWSSFQYSTNANPHIKTAEIETMRKELPERVYRQEILAEFVEDGAYFQGVERAAIITQPEQPDAHKGHYLVMGCDWALSEDYSVFVVACRECNCVVDWWRGNQLDYTYQREKLVSMAERWRVQGALPERNSIGEPNIELLRDRVSILLGPDGKQGFSTTATSKPMLIQGLANALEHGGYRVPQAAADELRSYQVETMASGHPKFSAPEGLHDDFVIALALAWYALTSARVQVF